MYETVLLATDGSDAAAAAIPHASDLAKRYDAALHVLHVVETDVFGPGDGSPALIDALERSGEQILDETISRIEAAGVGTVEGVVARGSPHRAILDYADAADVDLVVVGTHGRTGLERFVLGSVAERVVRLSEVPVLTVPPHREG